MPTVTDKVPQPLRAFADHGVKFVEEDNSGNALADCPFCFREKKFSVNIETGQWRCFVCAAGSDRGGGNAVTFIRLLHERSMEDTVDYEELAVDRKLLYATSLKKWGLCKSSITGKWLVPGYAIDGQLTQLYKYSKVLEKDKWIMRLIPTSGLSHHIHGLGVFDKDCNDIYLCEGPWDGIAWWEILSLTRRVGDRCEMTGNEALSMLSTANVLAFPGCGSIGEPFKKWLPLFAGKRLFLMCDSDHPKQINGKVIEGAGIAATKRIVQLLVTAEEKPTEVHYLNWGKDGYDSGLPSGYDVRDYLSATKDPGKRVSYVSTLLSKLTPVPTDWVDGRLPTSKSGSVDMDCLPCSDWKTLTNSWRVCMKWTVGLERALSAMLACVVSTKAVGDQLWFKIVGPAACLHGDTPIYDPLLNETLTVAQRCILGKEFHVLSVGSNSTKVAKALPPKKFPAEPMYHVLFESGKSIKVTGGHKFWSGNGYVGLQEIKDSMASRNHQFYTIPTMSEAAVAAISNLELIDVDGVVKIESIGDSVYYDFHVPETNNYWAVGWFHHNCGKSTLCEALSVNKEYIYAKSAIRGFHSGHRSDKGGEEDHGLVPKINGKTLVTKDGDTLLQTPNKDQILSEARDLYDGTARVIYRQGVDRNYENIRITWILCGTSSLRKIDSSELGERFLDCVIMEGIDDQLEDDILWRVVNKSERSVSLEANGKLETQHDPTLALAMQLTGGYVSHLRKNAQTLLSGVFTSDDVKRKCMTLGKFVAYMRARPSTKQDETAERELAARLVSQLMRLAKCTAVVLNKKTIDEEVMARVRGVALDTARGRTLEIVKHLYRLGTEGASTGALAVWNGQTEDKERVMLRFLKNIGAITLYTKKAGNSTRTKWVLTDKLRNIYKEVLNDSQETGDSI